MGGSEENKAGTPLGGDRVQLDGAWSFEAQIGAIKSCNKVDDLSFKEKSVKDVSDRGRTEGAARLQQVLEDVLSSAPSKPAKAATAAPKTNGLEQAEETEVRREVRGLLQVLQGLRTDGGPVAKRNAIAMDVLRQLDSLNVSVACLKSTKIAAELNQPYWRGTEVSEEVRRYASSLVREWRAMYKAETGGTTSAISPAVLARKCKSLSMDLEECAYGRHQRVAQYIEVVNCLCGVLKADYNAGKELLDGTLLPKQLVARAGDHIRRRLEKTKRSILV